MNYNLELLEQLTGIYGPSGDEVKVSEFIIDTIKEYVDDIKVDKMGNVIAHKKGNGPKVMLAGHMDQIGMMVTKVDKKGFVYLTNVGGINPFITHGERVVFKDGTVGVAYAKKKENYGKLKLTDIYVDIGAKNKEEAEEKVNIGDVCVYKHQFDHNDNTISTGALDDRIGCFILMEALRKIETVNNDCYFVFTVQEEVGLRGSKTSAYGINPDIGLAVDITGAGDVPGADVFEVSLHGGAAIKIRDNSLLSNPQLNKFIFDCCEKNDIKYQREVLTFGGTDAGGISLTREGIPATCISVPTRYAHSAHETISKEDLNQCINLVVDVLKNPIEL